MWLVLGEEKGKIKQIERAIKKKFDYKPIPAGTEICERQLFSMIDRVKTSEVNHDQIDPYMDKVLETLEELDKKEIIKRFVSVEFNRFLNYYKEDVDINVDMRNAPRDEKRTGKRGNRSMSRVIFNVGKGKGISKKDVIDLLVESSGRRDIEIGQIDIFKRASSVEIESKAKDNTSTSFI